MVRIPAPMLATPGQPPPPSPAWRYELKFDGQRGLILCEGGVCRIWSRALREISGTYPDVTAAVLDAARGRDGLLLDGEIVVLGASGAPSFSRLQQRMHARATTHRIAQAPAVFVAFDLLREAHRSTMDLPYTVRRERLEALELSAGRVQVLPDWGSEIDPQKLLEVAGEAGYEGIVAKRADSRYRSGRSTAWRKTVLRASFEALIGGWLPGRGGHAATVGSLILAGHEPDGSLRYIGCVGTGFTERARSALRAALDQLARADAPVHSVPAVVARAAHWCDPLIVADIECREVSADGVLRHPSFRGIRTDLDPAGVTVPAP